MQLRKVRDPEDARACLAQVESSGMERAVWARAHGVSPRSLNMWRLILKRQSCRDEPAARLVELVPLPRPAAPARYVVRCGPWEVELDQHVDGDVLRRILDVVSTC